MKRFLATSLPSLALLALTGAASAQPAPPPPPYDQGPGSYNDQGYPQDQGYPGQDPYYEPMPDGQYQDQNAYDDQEYPEKTADQGPVDESVFYSELAPYGHWIQRRSYGWVWEPTRVPVGWRPYTEGHWVDTDYGWTWVSNEPWGWATDHYGRWTLDPEYGWLWVPGTEWGPAWVSFQEGNGYVGWAPLPPSVGFRAGFGIQLGGLNLSVDINPMAYSFVPERVFLADRIATEIVPPARNVTFLRNSRNITNIRVENHRVINRSIPEDRIQQATGRPVHHYRLNEVRNPAQGRVARVQGDQVTLFRPAPTLTQARPNDTPTQVIQRHQQLRQQRQAGQSQPDRQPAQTQPQTRPQVRPQPVPQLSAGDLDRKHQSEVRQLQARQEADRTRLQQEHQRQTSGQQTRGRMPDLQSQQQAEQRALQDQQRREQQLLQSRQQRERQVQQPRPPAQPNPQAQHQQPPQQQPQRETQQRRQREQERARQEQQQRDKQPPPPPL